MCKDTDPFLTAVSLSWSRVKGAAASHSYMWAEAGYAPELVVSSLQGPMQVFGVSEPEPCTTDDIIMIFIVNVVIIVTVIIIIILLFWYSSTSQTWP